MKMNKELLPIKSHYFLQYAGSSFLTMVLPVMIRQKGVTTQGIGVIFTVMPILGLLVNGISGTLADYYKAHRIIFLFSISSLTSGLISIYCLPDIPTLDTGPPGDVKAVTSESFDATGHSRKRTIPADVTKAGETRLLKNVMGIRKDVNILTMSSSLGHDVMHDNKLSILKIDPVLAVEEGHFLLQEPHFSSTINKEEEEEEEEEEERQEDVGQSPNVNKGYDFSSLVKTPQFWFIFLGVLGAHVGLNLCIMIADAVCFQILGPERHKYGLQRLWGTLGMGLMAIIVGAIVDAYSSGLPGPDYLPAIIICGVMMAMDLGVVAKMDIPYTKDLKIRMRDVRSVLLRPHVIIFLVAVYVISTSMGILWVFKMMMIEDVALAWHSEFPHLKLLQGLDLGIETFGGEAPFFFLSGKIISSLGHTTVLSISMASMAVRCCLYYFVRNPWWFLPVELLNGLSYSLFHAVMASYASHVAPPGAQATLQAITRTGLSFGLSTAGFIGGHLYSSLRRGGVMYLLVGLFNFAFCFLYSLLSFVFRVRRYDVDAVKAVPDQEDDKEADVTLPLSEVEDPADALEESKAPSTQPMLRNA